MILGDFYPDIWFIKFFLLTLLAVITLQIIKQIFRIKLTSCEHYNVLSKALCLTREWMVFSGVLI